MSSPIDSRSFFEKYLCCCNQEPQEIPKGMRVIKVKVQQIYADIDCTKASGQFGITREANSQTEEAMKMKEIRKSLKKEN